MNTPDEQDLPGPTSCASCGIPVNTYTTGTRLCNTCRTQFIAYPIPRWIKIFGGLILCVLIFSLFTVPKNIQTGIHYKRGLKAVEAKNFMTAEKEFSQVVAEEPDYLDAKCRLLIASFYNSHFNVFFKTSETLENKKIEDTELFNQMQQLVNRAITYFPKDSFAQIMRQYNLETDSIPEAVYKSYLSKFPEDDFATCRLASFLFDHKQHKEADSLLNNLLAKEPSYYAAI